MAYFLNYYNDMIAPRTTEHWPAARRMVFVWKGACSIGGKAFEAGTGTHVEGEMALQTGDAGALLFRWELAEGASGQSAALPERVGSMLRMSREIWSLDLAPGSEWLFRLDEINNPPGLVADVHTHQGPGIRALLSGSFACRQPSEDGAADCPGDPWWETGIEAVISTPDDTEISKFLRCMILPVALRGSGNSGFWHRNKILPPPDWPIWRLLDEAVIRV